MVSLLERKLGFEIVMQLADTGKRPSSHFTKILVNDLIHLLIWQVGKSVTFCLILLPCPSERPWWQGT
jgi:hypothetical protein